MRKVKSTARKQKITKVYDSISNETTTKIALEILENEGELTTSLPPQKVDTKTKVDMTHVKSVMMT